MNEQHQQYNSQSIMYDNDSDMEQREGLLRSLVQNSSMLWHCYQFIEFTRARSVQPSFHQKCYRQSIQGQQSIPSILN
ncbi:unnamed protein product, partial [Rotaria sp. Silwood1]